MERRRIVISSAHSFMRSGRTAMDIGISLEEMREQQSDLVTLTADRPLKTSEIFVGNDYYGMASVLKRYAGVPSDVPLRALVPHGVYLSDSAVAIREVRAGYSAVLAYPEYRASVYAQTTRMASIPSASPYLYALQTISRPDSQKRAGTLLLPVHSTRFSEHDSDYERLADMCSELPQECLPVTVCVYFRDIQLGKHKPFIRKGYQVVTAGHIHDPAFLYRLAGLLTTHRYAAGNSLSSHVFYALASGCAYFDIELAMDSSDRVEAMRSDLALSDTRQREVRELRRSLGVITHVPTAEQVEIAETYLGARHLCTPEGLSEQLAWCDRLDARGRLFVSVSGDGGPVLPGPVRRLGYRSAAFLRSRRARLVGSIPKGVKGLLKRWSSSGGGR